MLPIDAQRQQRRADIDDQPVDEPDARREAVEVEQGRDRDEHARRHKHRRDKPRRLPQPAPGQPADDGRPTEIERSKQRGVDRRGDLPEEEGCGSRREKEQDDRRDEGVDGHKSENESGRRR